jgi:hypothetical protein
MEDVRNYSVMCGRVNLTVTFSLLLLFYVWRMTMITTKITIPIHTKLTYYNKFATTNSIIAKFIIPLLMVTLLTPTPTHAYLIPTSYDTCKTARDVSATAIMGSLKQNNTINVRASSFVSQFVTV